MPACAGRAPRGRAVPPRGEGKDGWAAAAGRHLARLGRSPAESANRVGKPLMGVGGPLMIGWIRLLNRVDIAVGLSGAWQTPNIHEAH